MKIFSALLAALVSFQASAALITGDMADITGQAYSPPVRFIPLTTPLAYGAKTVLDVPRSVQPTNGVFAISLVGGYYNADFGAPNKPVKILVPPNDTNAYNFNYVAALATNLNAFSYTNALDLVYLRRPSGTLGGYVLTATDASGHYDWLPPSNVAGGETNTASNVGNGIGVFKAKAGADLQLRSLTGAGGAMIGSDGDTITITAPTTNGFVTQAEINTSSNALQAATQTLANNLADAQAQELADSNQLWQQISAVGSSSVTSVALSAPSEFIVSGSPIAHSGTLTLSKANQSANTMYSGPVSGSAGVPFFRSLVPADIPPISLSKISDAGGLAGKSTVAEADLSLSDNVSGNVSASRHGFAPKAPGDASRYLDGSGAWSVPPVGNPGTVTSVGLSVPSEFTVGGSPVTASGTFLLSKANQTVNTVYAGPASGGAGAPVFRSLVAADIPLLTLSKIADVGTLAGKSTAAESDLSLTDNTTGNASTSRHGFTPKTPGDTSRFLDGSGAWSVPPLGGSTVIAANTTFYVRVDGNDSNGGRNSGDAWLTINRAVDFVTTNLIVAGGVTVTIQLGDGTYNETVLLTDFPGRGTVKITGNAGTPANVVVNGPGNAAFLVGGKRWTLSNLKVSSAASSAIVSADGGVLTLAGGIVFGSVAANNYHLYCYNGGSCWVNQAYTIAAGAANHWRAERCGTIINSGSFTVTIQNSPNFTEAFAVGTTSANICTFGVTFSGTVTGKRYVSVNNGVINTFGSGANYFPGNSVGTTSAGGLYL